MEEKKNSAIEKVENIIREKQGVSNEKQMLGENKYNQSERFNKRVLKYNEDNQKKEERKSWDNGGYNGKNRGTRSGFVFALISLAMVCLGLATALTISYTKGSEEGEVLESLYRKSYYDTIAEVDNMDLNMSKALASKEKSSVSKFLTNIAVNSELAESNIQQLPIEDESKFNTSKLINQIGDYAKYLGEKIARGENLSEEEAQNLYKLYKANEKLKNALIKSLNEMDDSFEFISLEYGKTSDFISDFNELENLSVDYPQLIYDGPFSDGKDDRDIKGLSGNAVSYEKVKENFTSIFSDYNLKDIKDGGESKGSIESFNISGETYGETLFAEFSKVGGKLILFNYSGSCGEVKIGEDDAIEKGERFLTKLGVSGMKAVWVNLSNNVFTINFAFSIDDVIVYPDLIKIRVCAETGMVIGLDAVEYYTNHTNRSIEDAVLSESEAREKVSDSIDIETSRLAIVPLEGNKERLCYEFSGIYDESMYYVYIDVKTGEQVEIFKVIKSGEGTLLM